MVTGGDYISSIKATRGGLNIKGCLMASSIAIKQPGFTAPIVGIAGDIVVLLHFAPNRSCPASFGDFACTDF